VWSIFALAAAIFCLGATPLYAQSAIFMGALVQAGGGAGQFPHSMALDLQGNLWLSDYPNSSLTEYVAVNGVLPTDLATAKMVTVDTGGSTFQAGLAVDSAGNLWVADDVDNAIREIIAVGGVIPSNPTIKVMIDTGITEPWGLSFDASGNLWFCDRGSNSIKEALAVGGAVPANPTINVVGSGFNNPYGVWVDAHGNVFVADYGNSAVKEMVAVAPPAASTPPANPTINTIGSGFLYPISVAIDSQGNAWVADVQLGTFEEIVAVGGSIPANALVIPFTAYDHPVSQTPFAVTIDRKGDIFLAESLASTSGIISELVPAGDFGQAYVGVGATPQVLPMSISLPLLFGFLSTATVDAPTVLTQGAKALDFTDAASGTCDTNGTSYTYSAGNACTVEVTFTPSAPGIRAGAVELTSGGGVLAKAYVSGVGVGPLATLLAQGSSQVTNVLPSGYNQAVTCIAMDGSENIYYSIQSSHTVYELPWNGKSYGAPVDIGSGGTWGFGASILGCAVDGAGNVFVGDTIGSRVVEIPRSGSGFAAPVVAVDLSTIPGASTNLAIDGFGNLYFSSNNGSGVYEVPRGSSGYAAPVQLPFSQAFTAYGIALDAAGDVFATDQAGSVFELPTTHTGWGSQVTVASGLTIGPGLQIDAAGDLFVGQVNAPPIELPWNGSKYGSQVPVYPNLKTTPDPDDFVIDSRGNVFEADANAAIEELDWVDPPSLTFANSAIGSTSTDSPQNVLVSNIGNGPLLFASVNPSYPADFPEDTSTPNPCTAYESLSLGAYCYLSIEFMPQNSGPLREAVTVTDNNLYASGGASQNIAVSGTASGGLPTPTINWTPATPITYGTVLGGGDFSALAMVGATDVSYDGAFSYYVGSVSGTAATTSTILPGGNNTLCAQWTPYPSYASQYNSTSLCVAISVTAASTFINWSPASPVIYPAPLGAGQFNAAAMGGAANVSSDGTFTYYVGSVGGTVATTSTVLPVGNNPLCVQWTPSSGFLADYMSTSFCVDITVDGHAQVTDNETITVNDSEAVGVFTASPAIAVNAPLAFFSVGSPLGFGGKTGTQQTIAVINIGQLPMTLASVKLASGTAFSLSALQCFNGATTTALAPNGFCMLTVTYTGTNSATDADTLTFSDNAALSNLATAGTSPNFTQSIALTGTGVSTAAPSAPPASVSVSDAETITVNDSYAAGSFAITPIAVTAPVAYFSAGTPLGFGGNSGSQQTIAVSNIGNLPMTLTSVNLALGTAFSLSALQCFNGATTTSLPTSSACELTVTYTGKSPTTDTDTLTFTDNAKLSNLATAGSAPNYSQSITLNGTGGITSPPAAPPATVSVSDAETITVADKAAVTALLFITTGSLPPGIVGGSYSQTLQAIGGSATGYGWMLANGSLPAGLILSSGGAISGTPTRTGTSTFTVQVTDSQKNVSTRALSLTIDPSLSISPALLPAGTAEAAYTQTLSGSGGSGTGYAWSVTSASGVASLSAIGLSLSSTGAFSGTALAGQAAFAVQVTDSQGHVSTGQYQLTINKAAATVALSGTTQTYTGSPHTVTVTTTPTGLTTSCTYSGSSAPPVSAGTYPVVCTVNDANYQGSVNGTLAINNPVPLIASTSPLFAAAGGPAFTLTVTGSEFTPNSRVYWGSTQLSSTPVTGVATQLVAQVPTSAIAKTGIAAITVQTPTPGGGSSNSWQFEVSPKGNGTGKPPIITTITGTVTPGESASYSVKLPPGAGKLSVNCLNLPTGAACSYGDGTLTITTSSTTPAGSYTIVVVFTYTTSSSKSSAFILLPFLLLPLAFARRRWTKTGIGFVAVVVLVLLGMSTQGCAGGPTQYATSTGQVTLNVQ